MQRGVDVSGFVTTNNGKNWWFSHEASADSNRSLTQNISPQFGVTTSIDDVLTPMQPTDYTVSGQNGNIVCDTISGIVVPEEGLGLKRIYTITGRNVVAVGGQTYYLKRVGLVKLFKNCHFDYLVSDQYVLLAEIDLNQPITLNPQDAFSITLCWNQG